MAFGQEGWMVDDEQEKQLRRDTTLSVALDRSEAAEIRAAAQDWGMTPSSLLRESVLETIRAERRIRRR
jgi:hypothetical protein